MSDVQQRIDDLVKNHRVVLFMKGTAQFPMCGFSGRAIQILKACGVADLKTVNVLRSATPHAFRIWMARPEKPHIGNCAVPFIKRTTRWFLTRSSMRC